MTITESRKKANEKYRLKAYDRIDIRVKKGVREQWRTYAELEGKSLAQFITDAVAEHVAAK